MLGRFKKLWSRPEPAAEAPAAEGSPEEGDLGPPAVEYERFDEVLVFRTNYDLPLHANFETPLDLGDGRSEPLTLFLRTREAFEEGGFRYTADVTASEEAVAFLKERHGVEVQARGGREERRSEGRFPHRIRARSRHLPGFQGITTEISPSGLRLHLDGEVAPGTALVLDLTLDHIRLPDVKLRGEIIWCLPQDERTWWAGVRILDREEETWTKYLEEVTGAAEGGLTKKNFLDS